MWNRAGDPILHSEFYIVNYINRLTATALSLAITAQASIMPLRFAVGGISTESNGFVSQAADEAFMAATGFLKEDASVFELLERSSELGGALHYLQHQQPDCVIVPTVGARANSG